MICYDNCPWLIFAAQIGLALLIGSALLYAGLRVARAIVVFTHRTISEDVEWRRRDGAPVYDIAGNVLYVELAPLWKIETVGPRLPRCLVCNTELKPPYRTNRRFCSKKCNNREADRWRTGRCRTCSGLNGTHRAYCRRVASMLRFDCDEMMEHRR